ncbi:hypothetical protein D1007_39366 [Hordeum vulgare]|uniref:Uncharacterized protein n=1 Tax=Hordeum vulgare subsp. vulgare TaxID=112509 RepID=A0A8I6Y3G1_HORVV|nr:uncharacterized protein LOC123446965 [Hordeum vulgare subsp. vulgare]KAE8786784.1 hypothetical protein D1007_39366 [Hordeum vulgare]
MEKEKQKQGADAALLLALRCSRASLLLSSLRQPPPSTTATRRTSSPVEFELRNARLLGAELAAARRAVARSARTSAAEILFLVALAPLLILFVALLAAALAEAGAEGVA